MKITHLALQPFRTPPHPTEHCSSSPYGSPFVSFCLNLLPIDSRPPESLESFQDSAGSKDGNFPPPPCFTIDSLASIDPWARPQFKVHPFCSILSVNSKSPQHGSRSAPPVPAFNRISPNGPMRSSGRVRCSLLLPRSGCRRPAAPTANPIDTARQNVPQGVSRNQRRALPEDPRNGDNAGEN